MIKISNNKASSNVGAQSVIGSIPTRGNETYYILITLLWCQGKTRR